MYGCMYVCMYVCMHVFANDQVREDAMKVNPDGSGDFYALHIRRGDLQFKVCMYACMHAPSYCNSFCRPYRR